MQIFPKALRATFFEVTPYRGSREEVFTPDRRFQGRAGFTGIYSTRIRLQEGEEKIQAEEKNERLNDDNSFASEELENIFS